MLTKSKLRRYAVMFADRADKMDDAEDHDELHAASDVCIVLSVSPQHMTPYIERWLEALTGRQRDAKMYLYLIDSEYRATNTT